ncbi:MAG: relaxase/mobilization nuclease domain-containing protein [Methylococcales bacterium]|nr:relaxase/mobilization nuclease domain-containing protein [Methylococcales bacterium]
MILKGSQRAGSRQLAKHLINGEQNEHVTIHQIRGFIADTVTGALNEAYALSRETQCKQFMFSLSLNPPQNKIMPVELFENTLKRVEKKLGLENQPRIIVFHEKHGRRHAHCVWSRINIEEMKAINLPHTKLKLIDISKQLYLENGWQLPKGFINKSYKNPLNYTRAEWQQAVRTNQSPKVIKATFQECWAASNNKDSFFASLNERGYFVACGDRRGYVAIDIFGEIYSITRQIGVKKKELENYIGKAENLPSVDQVKESISNQLSNVLKKLLNEQNKDYQKKLAPLLNSKKEMTQQHRIDRVSQKAYP